MIDRETVYQIADYAIKEYAASRIVEANEARMRAAWATADHWAQEHIGCIQEEIGRIQEEYFAQTTSQSVLHWLRDGWARERIARRKQIMEAMKRS